MRWQCCNIPSLMRLSTSMCPQRGACVKPFCTLYTVVSAEVGKVLGRFDIFESSEMLGRGQVSFYLIEIPVNQLENRSLCTARAAYLVFLRVLVTVLLLATPILDVSFSVLLYYMNAERL